jgi:hypothetical protein
MFNSINLVELNKLVTGTHVHYGNYGRTFQVDEDGNEIDDKVTKEKRGRGRPKSYINACEMVWSPIINKVTNSWGKMSMRGK